MGVMTFRMIQPECQRINSALPTQINQGSGHLPRRPTNLKNRCNSSNALNKTEDDLDDGEISSFVDKKPNYHSAQRSSNKQENEERQNKFERINMLNAVKLAINEKRSHFLTGNTRSNTQGIHLLPSTNKVYRNTKRIDFSRRMHMMDRPIVIITFDGIIGHFHKEKIW